MLFVAAVTLGNIKGQNMSLCVAEFRRESGLP